MSTRGRKPTAELRDFQSKVALVTGGGSGIGRAAALLFARRAAAVAIVDIEAVTGTAVAEEIRGAGGRALFIEADLTSEDAVAAMVNRTVSSFGGLHCAFNNAGITSPAEQFHTLALDEWNKMIATNLTSVFLCMKHELAHMLGAGGGAIVNTSSGAGIVAAPGQPHYTAAKHGVLGLVKSAAREYAAQHIRVNAVCPGLTDTPMLRSFLARNPALEQTLRATTPTGRLGRPEEVAEAAVWLCSDAASFVSGEGMLVDGASVCR